MTLRSKQQQKRRERQWLPTAWQTVTEHLATDRWWGPKFGRWSATNSWVISYWSSTNHRLIADQFITFFKNKGTSGHVEQFQKTSARGTPVVAIVKMAVAKCLPNGHCPVSNRFATAQQSVASTENDFDHKQSCSPLATKIAQNGRLEVADQLCLLATTLWPSLFDLCLVASDCDKSKAEGLCGQAMTTGVIQL